LNLFVKPILTAHLFPRLEGKLLDLLRSLTPVEWDAQTIAPAWKVKDVAAHLLDTQLRRLSMGRDGYVSDPSPVVTTNEDLIAYINTLNRQGVEVYRRLSPSVLISLMEIASRQTTEYLQSLDPMVSATFGVSWAGEQKSANWFDTAREFTERWHHQQQIRLATNRPGIMTRDLYYPVLDCFMRALPFAYRNMSAESGTHARFNIAGDCGGSWFLYRDGDGWQLLEAPQGTQVSATTIPQEIAWRIFTKGIDRKTTEAQVEVTGDRELGLHVLGMVTIIG
jgi:uncharacterized protein (TIGR03083 family)